MMADFQNALIFRIFGVSKWGFCMGYSLCKMVDFQNALISPIFDVFLSGFFHRITLNDL